MEFRVATNKNENNWATTIQKSFPKSATMDNYHPGHLPESQPSMEMDHLE